MSRHDEGGFTITEVLMATAISVFVAALATDAIIRHQVILRQETAASLRYESQSRAISATRRWVSQSTCVLSHFGTLKTDRHTVVLEMPRVDGDGYRMSEPELLVLNWAEQGGYRIVITSPSAIPKATIEFPFGTETGEFAFSLLDAKGKDVIFDPAQATCIQLHCGTKTARFALSRRL